MTSTSSSNAPLVTGVYFDGQSAKKHPVILRMEGSDLHIIGRDFERNILLSALDISEPLAGTPRILRLPSGAHCEVANHAALQTLLAEGRYQDSTVVRLQKSWRWAWASVAVAVCTVLAGYFWGLPLLSEWLAFQLPEKTLSAMGDQTLMALDHGVFTPSKLEQQRQKEFIQKFNALRKPDDGLMPLSIEFRDGGKMGANAIALPNGKVIVTDQLIKIASNDEEVIGVLGHELGHLARRHSLRMLIQSTVVGSATAWYLGDISSIAAGIPAALLDAKFSRENETEADLYASRLLKANGMSPARLADMLEHLEASHKSKEAPKGASQVTASSVETFDYFASHPATQTRIAMLRQQ